MVELLKDVDAFDRYLYGVDSEGAYLERVNKVFKEINNKKYKKRKNNT